MAVVALVTAVCCRCDGALDPGQEHTCGACWIEHCREVAARLGHVNLPRYLPKKHPATGKAIATPSREPERSLRYMEFIRELPCASCSAPPRSDPHHVGRQGMGQKVDDFRCVPLCRRCHDMAERGTLRQREWFDVVIARCLARYFRLDVTIQGPQVR